MNWEKYTTLWLHRYHKYSYIFRETTGAYIDIVRFWIYKKRNNKDLVAIIRTEHFGDIVAAEPTSRQIRALYPTAHIVWFVRPVFRELVERNPNVDAVWPQSSVLRRIILCESGVFDMVYNMEFWQSNLDKITGRVHQNPIAAQKGITVHNYFDKGNLLNIFQTVSELPIEDHITPQVFISEDDRNVVDGLKLPTKIIVLHCNSNFSPKDWTIENWQRLIDWLIENKDFTIVEIGLKSQNKIQNSKFINLCGRLSVLQTAEVIRRANCFIGIDSGPAHLANAVGTFGIILIGRLNEFENQMPYSGTYQSGKNVRIIRQGSRTCAEMDYDWVLRNIENFVSDYINLQPSKKMPE